MLRRFIEKLDDRSVPSVTTVSTTAAEGTTSSTATTSTTDTETDTTATGTSSSGTTSSGTTTTSEGTTTTGTSTSGTTTGPTDTTTDDTTTETPDETVQTVGGTTLPVEFGEGNFTPLGVGAKYILLSGQRNGEARLYGFDTNGQLFDTGKSYTPFPGDSRLIAVRGVTGDFNGDGVADLAFVKQSGGVTEMRITNGKTGSDLVTPRTLYGEFFNGGAHATAADLNGDGRDEIIVTPDASGGPRVRIFSINDDGTVVSRADFFGLSDVSFRGGIRTSAGDINGDGHQDLVLTTVNGGGTSVTVFDGAHLLDDTGRMPVKLVDDFQAVAGEEAAAGNGVSVSLGDLNADGYADFIIGSANGSGSNSVTVLDGKMAVTDLAAARTTPLASFATFDSRVKTGVRVAVKDIDGDGKADLVAGAGEGTIARVITYRRSRLTAAPNDPVASGGIAPFTQGRYTQSITTSVAMG